MQVICGILKHLCTVSYQVKFVKAKDDDDVGSSRQKKKIQGMTFVKASNDFSSVDITESQSLHKQVENIQMTDANASLPGNNDELIAHFNMLGACIRSGGRKFSDPVQHLDTMVQYTKMCLGVECKIRNNGKHLCEVSINDVFISSAEGLTEAGAERAAFESALTSLKKPYMQLLNLGPNMCELHTSDLPILGEGTGFPAPARPAASSLSSGFSANIVHRAINPHQHKRKGKKKFPRNKPLEQFILLEPLRGNYDVNAVSILHESGAFNKVPVNFDFQ